MVLKGFKLDFKAVWFEDGDYIHPTQSSAQWQVVVNALMNAQIP